MTEVIIPTDVGNLILTQEKARHLIRDIAKQLDIDTKIEITSKMLEAGIKATWFNIGYPKKFLDTELEQIVRRVYLAMRQLEG